MPHIHEKIDFVVNAWVVYNDRVLLILHKELKKWLPIGGHVELDEDPEAALFREVKEECGLDIEVFGEKPQIQDSAGKFLLNPSYLDIHPVNKNHSHIALEYFARAKSDVVKLAEKEHDDIRWFNKEDLNNLNYDILPVTKFLAEEALRRNKNG